MILYEKDWDKYPGAVVDLETTNKSFLEFGNLLRSMNVKNWYFHLSLLQADLTGVNPFSSVLSPKQKAMIMEEIRWNPWYFFREVARIPPDGSGSPARFRADRANISMFWCFLQRIDYGQVMPRQCGKSVGSDFLEIWLQHFRLINTTTFLFTKDSKLRNENMNRMKGFRDTLPEWMIELQTSDLDNSEVYTYNLRNNKMITAIARSVKADAMNVGRGYTIPIVRVDEMAFIKNAHLSIPVALSATVTAREKLLETDIPFGTIFTTTAGKKDTPEGKFAWEKFNGGFYWNERLYDCKDTNDTKDVIRKGSSGMGVFVNGTFSHRQVGKTDEWVYDAIATTSKTKDDADRDYFNVWTSGSETSPLTVALLEAITNNVLPEPLHIETTKDNFTVNYYVGEKFLDQYLSNGQFAMGLDTSEALGRDANGCVLIDLVNLGVVMTSNVNEANNSDYANWIADMLIKYPGITLVPERKSSATTMMDIIVGRLQPLGIDIFKRVFNQIADNHLVNPTDYAEINGPLSARDTSTYLKNKKLIGFNTTGTTRGYLYDQTLQEAVKSSGHLIRDKVLRDQLSGLVVKNGRVDHQTGGHDDLVIAYLLAQWFARYGKNLSHYGIDPTRCMIEVSGSGALMSEEELERGRLLAALNIKIADATDQLKGAITVTDRQRYKVKLEGLIAQAKMLGDTKNNIDSIMRELEEGKQTKRSLYKAMRDRQKRIAGL